jgi:hypothetical protein
MVCCSAILLVHIWEGFDLFLLLGARSGFPGSDFASRKLAFFFFCSAFLVRYLSSVCALGFHPVTVPR